jgi:hypothetical protein
MADTWNIHWPAGVPDDPLQDGLSLRLLENGRYAVTESGQERAAPVNVGVAWEMTAGFPMSAEQFEGLWLPWWTAHARDGGCANGVIPFWLRHPVPQGIMRVPWRWYRMQGQPMRPERDGSGRIVWLSLRSRPQ